MGSLVAVSAAADSVTRGQKAPTPFLILSSYPRFSFMPFTLMHAMYAFFCPFRRMILRLAVLLLCVAGWTWAHAQADEGAIRGQVTDPSQALVAGARLTLTADGLVVKIGSTDAYGVFDFSGLPAKRYVLTVEAKGFRVEKREIKVKAHAESTVSIELTIDVQKQQVAVEGEEQESSPDRNLGAVVLRGQDLDTLATNSQDLKQQLSAMAGNTVSPQFYVDGFTTNRLPPKSSIREIRMNQNPYSAEYDVPGADRIEILTKAGTDKMHGDLTLLGEDSTLNSLNPFAGEMPPYWSFYSQGDASGPLTKNSSWLLAGAQQKVGSESFTHAVTSSTGPVYTQTIESPQWAVDFAPRVDFNVGKTQTVSMRYDYTHQSQDDLLQSQLSLASQAVATRNTDQVLQISDTQSYSPKLVNETRFQFERVNDSLAAVNGDASVAVEGAFNGGGNNQGQEHGGVDHYELQDYVSLLKGDHLLHFGGRFRDVRDGNTSTAGYNGLFTFSSIDAYEITEQGIAEGLTPAEIRALGGGASQFSITTGEPKVAVNVADLGLYFEDEWKISPNVTLTPGLRYETQTRIHDHADFAPRLSLGWSIGAKNGKPAKAVLRAGAGIFYQRFTQNLVLNAARQNGVLQQTYVVISPDFYPNLPTPNELGPATLPTIYTIDPRLHAPGLAQAGVGVDKRLFKKLSLSLDYTYVHGFDQLLTRNINAPLPGTYNPDDPTSGTRPLGTLQNVYQYESEGTSQQNIILLNVRYTNKWLQLYSYYIWSKYDRDTDGAASFPSNQYDIRADWGRASNDTRQQLILGAQINTPWNTQLTPFLIAKSNSPFNITVGEDLNGDSQFNDRPTFATDLSRASVYRTKWGNFDGDPLPGQTIIPMNYGTGPAFVSLNLQAVKNVPFGPRPASAAATPAPAAAKPGAALPEAPRPYLLSVGVEAQNLFNTVNGGVPIGVLGSPLFGESTNLATTQFTDAQANRIFYLQLTLNF